MSMPPNPWVIEPKAKPLHSGLKYLVLQVFKHQTHADMKLLGTTLELPAATTSCDLCAKCCPFTPIPRNLDCTKTLALLAAKSSDGDEPLSQAAARNHYSEYLTGELYTEGLRLRCFLND